MDAYNFLHRLIKKSQVPGQYDICDGCIYNNQGKCTFEGDPRMAQLPMGCPKRPDTQKVFELAKRIEKKSDSVEEKREKAKKVVDEFLRRFPVPDISEFKDRTDFGNLACPVADFEVVRDFLFDNNVFSELSGITPGEYFHEELTNRLEKINPRLFFKADYIKDGKKYFTYMLEEEKSKKASAENFDEGRIYQAYNYLGILVRNIDAIKKLLPEHAKSRYALDNSTRREIEEFVENSKQVAEALAGLYQEDAKIRLSAKKFADLLSTMAYPQINYADDLLDDIVYLVKEKEIRLRAGQKESKREEEISKKSQQFAPGPGPWEGSTTNEISQEVCRGTPERWDAGPFEQTFPSRVLMGTQALRQAIAKVAPIWSMLKTSYTAIIKESQLTNNMTNSPGLNINPNLMRCPKCNAQISSDSVICPNCGYQLRQTTASTFRLCYFCGQPVSKGIQYTLVMNQDYDIIGISHLECAQTAAYQYQGSFDEDDDFILTENAKKKETSFEEEAQELMPNDEIVLTKDFENYKVGELGRIVTEPEIDEMGLSSIRVDNKVYVKFDSNPKKIEIVPIDYLEKTSKVQNFVKLALTMPCPKGYVPTVTVVLDHCYLASDDPKAAFACHDRSCKYWRPTSKEEWDKLVELELSNPFAIINRVF